MRFSKWHALGNTYLLVERAEAGAALTMADALHLCDPHHGVGADGVLEVVEIRGAEADVVVWNPDGSQAELSGNGARIAALWLARRSGVAFPRIHLGGRSVPARVDGADVEVDLGPVHVGRPEALTVDGERLELTPVSVGNPHAVVRREPSRDELRRLGPLIERHERFPERTNVQLVRVDSPQRPHGRGLGARSGGDARLGLERGRRRGRGCRPRVVHEPRAGTPLRRNAGRRCARGSRRSERPGGRDLPRRNYVWLSSTSRPSGSRRYAERPHE